MKKINIAFVVIVLGTVAVYFIYDIYIWPAIAIIAAVKISNIYKFNKEESRAGKLSQRTKQLICIAICFALLLSVDSYYREGGNPYDKTDLHGHIVTKFESNDEQNKICIIVSEVENSEFGKYFKISSYVGKTRAVGNFRVFKEKGVVYEDPVIVNEEDNCRIIIKRKNMDNLVFIIPYYNIKS